MSQNEDKSPEVENPFAAAKGGEEASAETPKKELDTELLGQISVEDEDDSSDESFFWVAQRALWGVLKSMIILLVLFGIIWMIWGVQSVPIPSFGGDEKTENKTEDNLKKRPTITSKEKTQQKDSGMSLSFTGGKEVVKDASSETKQSDEKPSIFGRFTGWIKSFGKSDTKSQEMNLSGTEGKVQNEEAQESGSSDKGLFGQKSSEDNLQAEKQSIKDKISGLFGKDEETTTSKTNSEEYHPHKPNEPHTPECRGRNIWTTSSDPLSIDLRDRFTRRNFPRVERMKRSSQITIQEYEKRYGKSGYGVIPSRSQQSQNLSQGGHFGAQDNTSGIGGKIGETWNQAKQKAGEFAADQGFGGRLNNDNVRIESGSNGGLLGNNNQPQSTQDILSESGSLDGSVSGNVTDETQIMALNLARIERLVRVAESLSELMYERDHQSLVGQSVAWLKAAKQFSLVETQEVAKVSDPLERAAKIAGRIERGERLFADSAKIRAELEEQVRLWSATREKNQTAANQTRDLMHKHIELYRGIDAERNMQNLAAAQQNVALSEAYLEMYQSLLKNVNNFERLMRGRTIPVFDQR